ncbi:hypothetical protein HW932_04455 [Allochromatium humboldtianum]|uniref:Uncharacterized protein n=1 Tax=Allochromatium humboldtianum TaxID=504901 RepID=A0A850RB75_9GAMM|nr:hypothetical protein [Allochromatium humboldtianum]NVZ08507.1 hypothetical protein [Allochromatium humboldtianum]
MDIPDDVRLGVRAPTPLTAAATTARTPATRNAKQAVTELLRQLPDDCTLEDIQYHLYVMEKAERGREDIAQGRGYLNNEAKQRLDRWLES